MRNGSEISESGMWSLVDREGPVVRIAAVGDLAFAGPTYTYMKQTGPESIFSDVRAHLANSQIRIGNLESVLVGTPYTRLGRQAYLISDLAAVRALTDAGFDIVSVANNHIMDAGVDGLAESLSGLDAAGIRHCGAGMDLQSARSPAKVSVNSITVRVHAYSYDAGNVATAKSPGHLDATLRQILSDLADHKEADDIVVVSLHMDAEFQPAPSPSRIDLCRALAENGVHIVLCHHPHVIQGIEVHAGSLIAYSLGNFVTAIDEYLRKPGAMANWSFILELDVDSRGVRSISVVPVTMDEFGRPVPAVGDTKRQILQMIKERSALLGAPAEVRRVYRRMVREFGASVFREVFWAIGERDWSRARDTLVAAVKPVKRRWLGDSLVGLFRAD